MGLRHKEHGPHTAAGNDALMGAEAYLQLIADFGELKPQENRRKTIMQLNERLEICLLALANRYSHHVVDINEEVLGSQSLGAEGWTSRDMIELLRHTQPTLLDAQADLIINTQESAIYLSTYSVCTPALHVHCRGKLPALKGNIESRRQAMKQPHTLLR